MIKMNSPLEISHFPVMLEEVIKISSPKMVEISSTAHMVEEAIQKKF